MAEIKAIKAREVLDSRGNPTVEVDLFTQDFMTRAIVPSGASTGVHEAVELRDKQKRYNGKGVENAVSHVNSILAPRLKNLDVRKQQFIDVMMKQIDGTENKSKIGANAILGVSMAVCQAAAKSKNLPLYKYISNLAEIENIRLPIPYCNVINGGKHAGNSLDIQEFMIVPRSNSFKESIRMAAEVYHALKKILKKKSGLDAVNVGDEGGFAPPLKDNEEPLKIIIEAISAAGYTGKIDIAMDCAASEFCYNGKYLLGKKHLSEDEKLSAAKKAGISGKELAKFYQMILNKYPIISIEDPFDEDDWVSWSYLKNSSNVQIVGDDLLVTNTKRIKTALEKNACNALLLKVNQIGTVTEAIEAAKLAMGNGWKVMVSHRSGETEDTFIADLAVGLGTGQIKSGAPCRGERTAKYNQLLRIEEEINSLSRL